MHDTIFSEQEREFKPMTRHTSSIQQTCLYPKRYNMMFVSGSMVLQLNKLHFHHIPSTQHQEAKPGMGSTLYVMCWVTTTQLPPMQDTEQTNARLTYIGSNHSFLLWKCSRIWVCDISLQDFIFGMHSDQGVAGFDREGWILLSILYLPMQCTL